MITKEQAQQLQAACAAMCKALEPLVNDAGETEAGAGERVNGRNVRHGHDRTAQLNIKMRPDVKASLAGYCERNGIAVTDWLEKIVLALPEG